MILLDYENDLVNDYGGFLSFDDDVCLSTSLMIDEDEDFDKYDYDPP